MVSETTPGGGSAPSQGLSGAVKLVLLASLALNLLIAGAALGSWWSPGRHGGGGTRGAEEVGVTGFAGRLPPERRKAIRKVLRENRQDLSALHNEVRGARQDTAAALSAEPFDAARLRESFERIDAAESRLRSAARESLIKSAESMTPGERRDLSAWWQSRKPHLFRERLPRGDGERRRKLRDGAPAPAEDAP